MRAKFALVLPIAGSLSGCSSLVTAIFDRPQIRDEIDTSQSKVVILTMTGDRRLTTTHNGKVCGESYPDVATAYGALSKATATASDQGASGSGNISDQFQTALLQTFNRTETADAIRQIGWQICQAYSNNGITEPEYNKLLDSLITKSFEAIDKRATAPPVIATGPGSVQVNLGSTPSQAGTPATGSGTGTPETGSRTGTPATGSRTGTPATGSRTGTPATGSGTGTPATGSGTGAPATGSGTEGGT
jgi:hypothetical protein